MRRRFCPSSRPWMAAWLSLLVVAIMAALASAPARAAGVATRTGVVVTPKNFPNHRPDDVTEMFRLAADVGSLAVMRVNWNDPQRFEAAQAMVGMAEREGLVTVLEFSPLKAEEIKGAALDPPKDLEKAAGRQPSVRTPAVAEALARAVLEMAELRPAYLAVATDVNLLQLSDPAEYAALAEFYKGLVPRIKQRSPATQVYVSFQWEAMQGRNAAAQRALLAPWRPALDLLTLSSDPRRLHESGGPGSVPATYYARAAELAGRNEPLFFQVTWPTEGKNGDADQVAFIQALPRLLGGVKPQMLAWNFLHDVKVLLFFTGRLGLRTTDGRAKPGWAAFNALGDDRPAAAQASATRGAPAAPLRLPRSAPTVASREPAQFAVFTAHRDGSDLRILISDPEREMTHPRVSPDRTRVVITRYTRRGRDGKATEEQGYEGTEILLMNLDGTGLETIVPARAGIVAANGCWTPDGKSLIFISTDTPRREPEVRQIDLATRTVTRVPTPAGVRATDPHWEAGQIVFPGKAEEGKGADALWLMNADGSNPRQITRPARSKGGPGLYGDFDPKLSPDGKRVAFMRNDGGESWKIYVLDVDSGKETLLTPPGPMQWLPTWSSDGRLLLYVHVDRSKPRTIGLYTMTPDGEDRQMIPLPRGYLYGHSTFFPGDGSGEKARIIFSGTPKAGL